MSAFRVVVAAVVAGMVAGCGLSSRQPPPAQNQQQLAADEESLPWAADEPIFVVIRKECRRLDVYQYGQRIRSFPVVFGMGGNKEQKLYEGDLRTPTGFYSIVGKREHPRWRHFFLLSYPNRRDQERYWMALEEGDIPQYSDGYAGIGGQVGIHGTDKPELNRLGVDWTLGCISLHNPDVEDLNALVYEGTPVFIED